MLVAGGRFLIDVRQTVAVAGDGEWSEAGACGDVLAAERNPTAVSDVTEILRPRHWPTYDARLLL